MKDETLDILNKKRKPQTHHHLIFDHPQPPNPPPPLIPPHWCNYSTPSIQFFILISTAPRDQPPECAGELKEIFKYGGIIIKKKK